MPTWNTPPHRPTRNFWQESFYYLDLDELPTAADSAAAIAASAAYHVTKAGNDNLMFAPSGQATWDSGYPVGYFVDTVPAGVDPETIKRTWNVNAPNSHHNVKHIYFGDLRQQGAAKNIFGQYSVVNGGDRHAICWSEASREMFEAIGYNGTGPYAQHCVTYDLDSYDLPPAATAGYLAGTNAGRFPIAPLFFTYQDLLDCGADGELGHMVGIVLQDGKSGVTWPARASDYVLASGLQYGNVLRLPASFNLNAISNLPLRALARTLKKRGGIIFDRSGVAKIVAPNDPMWPSNMNSLSTGMFPISAFEVVDLSSVAGQANSIRVKVRPNDPPVALQTYTPIVGTAPLEVDFDGSGSTSDAPVVSYTWDYGDGVTEVREIGEAPTPTTTIFGRTAAQLTLMKSKVTQGSIPWVTQYNKMLSSGNARVASPQRPSLTRFSTSGTFPPAPVSILKDRITGYDGETATLHRWLDDAYAAHTQALMWYLTGNTAHRTNALNLLNAWPSVLTKIEGKTDTQASAGAGAVEQPRLYTAWAVPNWVAAADIMRHHSGGLWTSGEQTAFENMLVNKCLPMMDWQNVGNWSAAFAESRIAIGAFVEDSTIFNFGCDYWLDRIPRSIYLTTDGARPGYPRAAKMPPWPTAGGTQYAGTAVDTPDELAVSWYYANDAAAVYIDGLSVEVGRDLGHTVQGINAWVRGAETAYHNGRTDLYSVHGTRLRKALELTAAWMREALKAKKDNNWSEGTMDSNGWKPSGRYNLTTGLPTNNGQPWLSTAGNQFTWGGQASSYGWELGYRHFKQRLGLSMPNVEALLNGWTDGGTYGNLRGTPGGLSAGPVTVGNQFIWDALDAGLAESSYTAETAAEPSHVYGFAGSYTPKLTVTDEDGATTQIVGHSWLPGFPLDVPPNYVRLGVSYPAADPKVKFEDATGLPVNLHKLPLTSWASRDTIAAKVTSNALLGRSTWASLTVPNWAAVVSGTYNAEVAKIFGDLRKTRTNCWLTVAPEPETQTSLGNVANWVAMYDYLDVIRESYNAQNVQLVPVLSSYTFNPASGRPINSWLGLEAFLFPVIGVNLYTNDYSTSPASLADCEEWRAVITKCTEFGFKVAVSEMGGQKATTTVRNVGYWNAMIAEAVAAGSIIKAVCWSDAGADTLGSGTGDPSSALFNQVKVDFAKPHNYRNGKVGMSRVTLPIVVY